MQAGQSDLALKKRKPHTLTEFALEGVFSEALPKDGPKGGPCGLYGEPSGVERRSCRAHHRKSTQHLTGAGSSRRRRARFTDKWVHTRISICG